MTDSSVEALVAAKFSAEDVFVTKTPRGVEVLYKGAPFRGRTLGLQLGTPAAPVKLLPFKRYVKGSFHQIDNNDGSQGNLEGLLNRASKVYSADIRIQNPREQEMLAAIQTAYNAYGAANNIEMPVFYNEQYKQLKAKVRVEFMKSTMMGQWVKIEKPEDDSWSKSMFAGARMIPSSLQVLDGATMKEKDYFGSSYDLFADAASKEGLYCEAVVQFHIQMVMGGAKIAQPTLVVLCKWPETAASHASSETDVAVCLNRTDVVVPSAEEEEHSAKRKRGELSPMKVPTAAELSSRPVPFVYGRIDGKPSQ